MAATFYGCAYLAGIFLVSRHLPIALEQKVALCRANEIGLPVPGEKLQTRRTFTFSFHFFYSDLRNCCQVGNINEFCFSPTFRYTKLLCLAFHPTLRNLTRDIYLGAFKNCWHKHASEQFDLLSRYSTDSSTSTSYFNSQIVQPSVITLAFHHHYFQL